MISVVVPVYNASQYIGDALASIEIAMGKLPYEIIVINDGSTDDIRQALESWIENIVYITQENKGPASARNAGLRRARGEYVAFLDADDIWTEHHVALLLSEYEKNPALQIAMGHVQRFVSGGAPSRENFLGKGELLPSLGAAVIRASAFEEIGMLNEKYLLHEDVDWFFRAVEVGAVIAKIPDAVSFYRIHDTNTTHALKSGDTSLLRVLGASLKRRGAREILSLKNSAL